MRISSIGEIYTRTKGVVNIYYKVLNTNKDVNLKHYINLGDGQYKEIIPVGNIERGFIIQVEAEERLKKCIIKCESDTESVTSNEFSIQYIGSENVKSSRLLINSVEFNEETQIISIGCELKGFLNKDTLTYYGRIDGKDYTTAKLHWSYPSGDTYILQLGIENAEKGKSHLIQLKVIDGGEEIESEIVEVKSNLKSKIMIDSLNKDYIRANGDYRISMVLSNPNIISDVSFKYDLDNTGLKDLIPIFLDNKYIYYGKGLASGDHSFKVNLYLKDVLMNSYSTTLTVPNENISDLKSKFITKNSSYNLSYTELMSSIQNLLKNPITLDTAKVDIETKYNTYITETKNLRTMIQEVIDYIANNKTGEAKKNLDKEIIDLNNALGTLGNTMNEVFKDSVLTEAEKISIRQELQRLSKERVDVNKQYESLLEKFNNADLEYASNGTLPPDLGGNTPENYPNKQWYLDVYNGFKRAYSEYELKYKNLIVVIDFILNKEGLIDSEDKKKLDITFDEYSLAISEYSKRASLAIEGIARNESENNATYITEFKAEYIRDNVQNTAKLEALTKTDTELNKKYSEIKQTAEGINTKVGELEASDKALNEKYSNIEQSANFITLEVNKKLGMTDYNALDIMLDSSSKIQVLNNQISSAVTEGEFGTLIQQHPNSVTVAVKNGELVTIDEGLTVWNGYVACDRLTTPTGHSPIITLFENKNNGSCAIDATAYYNYGTGESIRLKWDNQNYIRVETNRFACYMSGYENGSKNVFNISPTGIMFKGSTIIDSNGHIVDGHTHKTLSSPSTKVQCGSGNGQDWKGFVPIYDGTPLGRTSPSSDRWDVVCSTKGSISTSDRAFKENIKYINEEMTVNADGNIDTTGTVYDIKPQINPLDLYDFVKTDLNLATFEYKCGDMDANDNLNNSRYQIGFIAQDIENTKVGQYITFNNKKLPDGTIIEENASKTGETPSDNEGNLFVIENNYINTIAGALQVAIQKIEVLEAEIRELKGGVK